MENKIRLNEIAHPSQRVKYLQVYFCSVFFNPFRSLKLSAAVLYCCPRFALHLDLFCPFKKVRLNTLRTGDALLRLYTTTVQDG